MKSDSDLKRDVEAELRWSPDVDDTDIGINVQDSVVMLTGFVRSHFEKDRAEAAALRVKGVAGLANDIQVRLASGVPDPEIARSAVAALKSALPFSSDNIKVVVSQARVTLEGKLEWQYQKQQAESAVRYLHGVTGVNNLLQIEPKVTPKDVERRIHDAFRRSAQVDADRVHVAAQAGQITLTGTVSSWAEREQAQRTAWMAPGVTSVANQISVRP
jgi:osmotically-inducible protein OsmY